MVSLEMWGLEESFLSVLDFFNSLFAESFTRRGVLRDLGSGWEAREIVLFVKEAQEIRMLVVDSRRRASDDFERLGSQVSCRRAR